MSLLHLFENGLHGAHHEGQADEDQRQRDAQRRVGDLQADQCGQRTDDAIGRIDRRHGDAGHGRRQRKGQIDCGIDDAAAGKAIAHQHPGQQQPEHGIDERRQ